MTDVFPAELLVKEDKLPLVPFVLLAPVPPAPATYGYTLPATNAPAGITILAYAPPPPPPPPLLRAELPVVPPGPPAPPPPHISIVIGAPAIDAGAVQLPVPVRFALLAAIYFILFIPKENQSRTKNTSKIWFEN